MPPEPQRRPIDSAAAQQRFLSLFLRSEREIFRYVAAHFDSVRVEGNEIEAVGGWVSLIDYATLYSEPPPFVDSLTVIDNDFGPEEGSERGISADAADDVTIEDNTPEWINP